MTDLQRYLLALGFENIENPRLRIFNGTKGRIVSAKAKIPSGWNVCYPINGWSKDHLRVLVHEDDGPDDLDAKRNKWTSLGLMPTLQVYSGNKSIHSYWVLDEPVGPEKWAELQKKLRNKLGGDGSLHDLGQVMRVPGYPHPKTGTLCEIIAQGQTIDLAAIESLLPELEIKPTRDCSPRHLGTDVLDALTFLAKQLGPYREGQGTYPVRLRIAYYLKETDNFGLWVDLFGDDGCGRANASDFFDSLTLGGSEHCGAGSIIHAAKEMGWQHPILSAASLEEASQHDLTFVSRETLEKVAKILEAQPKGPGRPKAAIHKLEEIASKQAKEKQRTEKELKRIQSEQRIEKAKAELAEAGDITSIAFVDKHGQITPPSDRVTKDYVVESLSNKLRNCPNTGNHHWTGTHWAISKRIDIRNAVEAEIAPLNPNLSYVNRVTDYLMEGGLKRLKPESPNCISFKNGVLDGGFKPHNPDNLNRSVLGFDYDPEAKCPKIDAWLDWCQTGKRSKKTLLALLRCALKGRGKSQIFGEVTGVSRSGKSTFVNLCRTLAGAEYSGSTTPRALESERFGLAPLVGMKLITLNDIGKYGGEVNNLKALTGGDTLHCERKGENQPLAWTFKGLILIVGEHTLKTSDYQSGIARRRVQLHFSNRVEADKVRDLIEVDNNGNITGEFAQELPGLVNKLLEMSDEEMNDLLTNREELEAEDPEFYREQIEEQNPIAGFLQEVYEPHDGPETIEAGNNESMRGLYYEYKCYCNRQGITPVAVSRFGRDCLDTANRILGWQVTKPRDSRGVKYQGLKKRA